jgi:glycosyltransferase involved in cell wall biosynthesis
MAGGSRFKILEAMAAGIPVVSTTAGIAGIAASHEEHALVADSARAFAESAARLLLDRELAQSLAAKARALMESRYDWAKIGQNYLRILTSTRHATRQSH